MADQKAGISRLKEEQDKSVEDCNHRLVQWKQFETDYTKLHSFLENVSDKLSYDVMVPFGKLAFMPGRLVNTNNVLALLGDNWFVEHSTKDAQSIVQRRIAACQKTLKKVEEEKVRINAWKEHTYSALESGEFKEIREEYDETVEPSWGEKRKQDKRLQQFATNKLGSESRVRWQEDQKQPAQITFQHSVQSDSFVESSDNEVRIGQAILSPGDIVRVFEPKCIQPKPILKASKTASSAALQEKSGGGVPVSVDVPVVSNKSPEEFNQAFTGTIVEKSVISEREVEATKIEPSRPTSKFKARKAKQ